MAVVEPEFTLGIEEEYLLVQRKSRDLVAALPPTIMEECEAELEGQVSPEFLQSQGPELFEYFRTVRYRSGS